MATRVEALAEAIGTVFAQEHDRMIASGYSSNGPAVDIFLLFAADRGGSNHPLSGYEVKRRNQLVERIIEIVQEPHHVA